MSLKQRIRNLEKRFSVTEKPASPPPIIGRVVIAGPRNALGERILPLEPDDIVRCICNENSYDRLPDETEEDFTNRVLSLQPKDDGKLLMLTLLPRSYGN